MPTVSSSIGAGGGEHLIIIPSVGDLFGDAVVCEQNFYACIDYLLRILHLLEVLQVVRHAMPRWAAVCPLG
mgnify:CR=1 FL=1